MSSHPCPRPPPAAEAPEAFSQPIWFCRMLLWALFGMFFSWAFSAGFASGVFCLTSFSSFADSSLALLFWFRVLLVAASFVLTAFLFNALGAGSFIGGGSFSDDSSWTALFFGAIASCKDSI